MKKSGKKILGVLILSLMLFSFMFVFVSAQGSTRFTRQEAEKSNLMRGIGGPLLKIWDGSKLYILGIKDISKFPDDYAVGSIIIIFALVWLILFVTFSDILRMFSPFSQVVSWIVGFALAVIAANLSVVQLVVAWLISWVAVFGAISVFMGIILAFVAFVALSWGGEWARRWVVNRKAAMYAHKGRTDIAEGIKTFAQAGRETRKRGRESGS